MANTEIKTNRCPLCAHSDVEMVISITKKPDGETDFRIQNYYREIIKCNACGVFFNVYDYPMESIYTGKYNKVTYNNEVKKKYDQIMEFPIEKSDNKNRVTRIRNFADHHMLNPRKTYVLDVGSGLCVFLGELRKYGYKCACIDPDPISTQHAEENVKVDYVHNGTLNDFRSDHKFDIITFNKVLEHVQNPIGMLRKSKKFLKKNGYVYIELPDSKAGDEKDGFLNREEFYLGHYYIFNKRSINHLAEQAGFHVIQSEQIRDPSGKYTIYAFLGRGGTD